MVGRGAPDRSDKAIKDPIWLQNGSSRSAPPACRAPILARSQLPARGGKLNHLPRSRAALCANRTLPGWALFRRNRSRPWGSGTTSAREIEPGWVSGTTAATPQADLRYLLRSALPTASGDPACFPKCFMASSPSIWRRRLNGQPGSARFRSHDSIVEATPRTGNQQKPGSIR